MHETGTNMNMNATQEDFALHATSFKLVLLANNS